MIALRGLVVLPGDVLEDGVVVVDGDRIERVCRAAEHDGPVTDVEYVLPGLVDIHCHGGGGASFTTGDPEQVHVAAMHHLRNGTTTLVGSTVTDTPARLLEVIGVLADACDAGELAAIHLEGPFLAENRCGAQDPALLRDPDPALTDELLAAGRGHVGMMTLAPELPGAADLAAALRDRDVVPAVGHTDASAELVADFLAAGGHVTHMFNGMAPMTHRAPGPVAGALAAPATYELIADGAHLADATVAWVLALAGDRVAFVSDAMAAAGMADGDYTLGPQRVVVRDGVARLADGDSIAGGTARLADIVRRHHLAGIAPPVCVRAATLTPSGVLGLSDRGVLAEGARADIVVADEELRPARVLRAGRWVE